MSDFLQDQFNMDDVFNMNVDNIITQERESFVDPDIYNPSLKNEKAAKTGQYDSHIRFVPNVFAKQDNLPADQAHKINKKIYYLADPNKPDGNFYVDCPSSDPTDPRAKTNIISTAHFTLKKNDSAFLRNLAFDRFSRKEYWYSLVQIIKDEYQPDFNNTIKIFRFGVKINEKIDAMLKGDAKYGVPVVNIYDPILGREMILNIKNTEMTDKNNQTKKITDYSTSKFMDVSCAMSLNGLASRIDPTSPTAKQEIFEYLQKGSPKLSKMAYQPWDKQMEEKVIESVRISINDSATFDKIYFDVYKQKYVIPATSNTNNDLSIDVSNPPLVQEPTPTPQTTADPLVSPQPTVDPTVSAPVQTNINQSVEIGTTEDLDLDDLP
jgi:hypothetical protein